MDAWPPGWRESSVSLSLNVWLDLHDVGWRGAGHGSTLPVKRSAETGCLRSSLITADGPLGQQRTIAPPRCPAMTDELEVLNLNCSRPFSRFLRSTFRRTARLQRLWSDLIWWIWSVFKRVWGVCDLGVHWFHLSYRRLIFVVKVIDLWDMMLTCLTPHPHLRWDVGATMKSKI